LTKRTSQSRTAAHRSFGHTGNFLSQVERERYGVSITEAEALRRAMGFSVECYASILGIRSATYQRHRTRRGRINGAPGYAIGDLESMLHKLNGLVSADVDDFDSARWFADWIGHPQAALGGLTPAALLDTPAGRQLVDRLLGAMGSGAYL